MMRKNKMKGEEVTSGRQEDNKLRGRGKHDGK